MYKIVCVGIFLIASLDEIAVGVALILLIYYFTNFDWWVHGIIIVALAIVLAVKFYVLYTQFRKPQTGKEGMIGLLGRVVEPLNPEGQVKIGGETLKAKSIGNEIDNGEEIEMVDTEGLKLLIRKVKE